MQEKSIERNLSSFWIWETSIFEKFASNSTTGHFFGVFNDFLLSTNSKQICFKKISEKEKRTSDYLLVELKNEMPMAISARPSKI